MAGEDYDVIVAGGGLAGLLVATAVACYSHCNARVLVVDRNSREELGKKTTNGWTCGDAVSKGSVEYLGRNLGIHYSWPELEHPVKGILVFSPDHQTSALFEGEGYVLNRRILPQRQLQDAERLGVKLEFSVSLDRLWADDGYVAGVLGRRLSDGSPFKKKCKVVIDASGSASKLRITMPIKSYIEREIERDDLESTGRYIYEFERGEDDKTYFDPDYCLIHLDQYLAPGGYCWVFPKGDNKVNVGLGVQKSALDRRNVRFGLKDNLQSLIDRYVANNRCIINPKLPDGDEDRANVKGNWQVPVRRQNDCMVANGYALIGDAAWMPRPLDAGGIGPAIYASVILGKAVASAIEGNDPSEAALWKYNLEYMHTYGYQMASLEVLRRYLQTISNGQINYGMRYFLSEEDIADIGKRRHPKFERARLLNPLMLLRILMQYDLANGLRYTAAKSRALVKHNLQYPESPQGFPSWHAGLMRELHEAFERFRQ